MLDDEDDGLTDDEMSSLEDRLETLEAELIAEIEDEDGPWKLTVDEWLAMATSPDRIPRIRASWAVMWDVGQMRVLRQQPAVRYHIVELLTDSDPGVSAAAALALDDWDVPEALPVLLRLLPEVSVRHRCQLLLGLAGQTDPAARECLERYAAGDGEEARCAQLALRWAAETGAEGGAEL